MMFARAVALLIALTLPAMAQGAPKAKPAPDPVKESYAAMPEAERVAIQNDLIWSGDFNGTATPEFGPRAIAAVKAFQKRSGAKESGVLNPKERGSLVLDARKKREAVGWRIVDDGATGARLGIPTKLTPQHGNIVGGSRWASARGEVQVETFRISAPDTTLQGVSDAQRKVADRKISYSLVRPDFFVLSGLQGLKKFYVRGQFKDGQVRGFTILYDQAMEGTVDPVVIGMSSAFAPFPGASAAVPAAPPPRRKVEYGTGVVVDATGHVVTTRDLIDGCQVITLAGLGPADLVASDKTADLALLRIYGARDLTPIALAAAAGTSDITLVGIADPQGQGGGGSISTATARLNAGSGPRAAIEPAPAVGFAGAAALDRGGRLVGMVDLSVQVVAGPPPAAKSQAALIPAPAITAFLAAQKISATTDAASSPDAAKASVVRVICVRK